jgi:tetratricopeptide (TPR) repeat protein
MVAAMKRIVLLTLLALLAAPDVARAAEIDPQSALMLDAAAKFMHRDLQGAETLYTRVIGMNNHDANAYIQRGLVRQSMNNPQGMQADASRARELIDAALPQDGNNANLYYQRSLADRMLKDFDVAEQDLNQAQRLGAHQNFENDEKAIAVERKMSNE